MLVRCMLRVLWPRCVLCLRRRGGVAVGNMGARSVAAQPSLPAPRAPWALSNPAL